MIINDVLINDYERLDDLHRNNLKIIQDPKKFCFGVDAVLLSGFVKVKRGEKALDLGTGTGIIPILLTAKTNGEKFHGLEIQEPLVEMARRSVKLNNLEEKVSIDLGDIKCLDKIYKPSYFDVITTNPPYMNYGGGILNEYDSKAISRHEVLCSLDDVVFGASRLLKTNGRFYMIHRPHRLVDIICTMRLHNIEPKTLRFVHAYAEKEPSMVLVEGVRNGKPMLKVLPPLVIYYSDGKYTNEAYNIYYG